MRNALITLMLTAALALGGCALLSEETQTACDRVEHMYDNYPDYSVAEIGAQLDLCFAGIERDSKDWALKWAELENTLRDAFDSFLGGLWPFGMSAEEQSSMQAELKVQLDGYR